ncbi:hypothetical protein E2320_003510 [Naja naja]|nr:hypothetical protein E2320_003510 [Naja naja]
MKTVVGITLFCVSGHRIVLPIAEKGRRMEDLGSRIVALLLAISTVVSGQATVSQKPRFLSVKEGDPILLNCSYQGMEFSLQWYKQYPGGQPEFMVLLSTSGIKEKDNFKMTLDKNNKMTSLYLNNTQLKDSAVYFCALKHSARKSPAGVQCQDRVDQTAIEVIKEGGDSNITCHFNSNSVYGMHWYRQYAEEGPVFLLMATSVNGEKVNNFRASFDKQKKESHFSIAKVEMKDAAVYFCRTEDSQPHRGTYCLYKNVQRISKFAETPAEAWKPLECFQEPGKLICSLDAQIIQTPENLKVQEGSSFTVKCNYSNQYRPYFWYHQLPGEPPTLIVSISSQGSEENKGFVANMDAQIFQTPAKLEVQEGSSFILKCNCSMQYRTYFWYHQLPGEPPSLTLSISSQEDHNSKGFVTKYLEKGKESQLHRPKAQFQDSGSYFCAVDAQ